MEDCPFPELEVRFAAEDLTRVAQLLAGEVQMPVTPRSLNDQVRGGGMRIINPTLPGAQVQGFLGGQYL